jgi:ESS family glutamate:Na+ symporter
MAELLCATGFIGIFMFIGIFFRAKVHFLQKMLVPVSVIGGFAGLIFMNFIIPHLPEGITDASIYNTLTGSLFALSFITIGLTDSNAKKKDKKTNEQKEADRKAGIQSMQQGAIGLSCIWCLLYAVTPVIGVLLIWMIGSKFNMDKMYGMLIPFAFCQGPGQSATYGKIFEETYGFVNAQQVAVTFSVIGFLASFLVGVPFARLGIKKGIVKSNIKINKAVERGFLKPEEQRESMGKVTTFSGSIESLTIHFGLIGLTYLLASWATKGLSLLPVVGPTFSGMLFLWGLLIAYILKFIMKKLNVFYIVNKSMMSKITGFLSDFLILASFLSIQLNVLGNWLIPMVIECVVMTAVTFVICYFLEADLEVIMILKDLLVYMENQQVQHQAV